MRLGSRLDEVAVTATATLDDLALDLVAELVHDRGRDDPGADDHARERIHPSARRELELLSAEEVLGLRVGEITARREEASEDVLLVLDAERLVRGRAGLGERSRGAAAHPHALHARDVGRGQRGVASLWPLRRRERRGWPARAGHAEDAPGRARRGPVRALLRARRLDDRAHVVRRDEPSADDRVCQARCLAAPVSRDRLVELGPADLSLREGEAADQHVRRGQLGHARGLPGNPEEI